MSKKKKRGSALILVMVFSLFFIVISGVAATAVVSTLKANGSEEIYQTLYYEAEAGIEKVIALAQNGEYDAMAVGDIKNSTTDGSVYSFSMNEGNVEVSVKKCQDATLSKYLQVESKSTKRGTSESRTVKAKLRPWINAPDFFKYSICGKEVEAGGAGNIDLSTSMINSTNKAPDIAFNGGIVPAEEDNAAFDLPIFNTTYYPDLTINQTSGTLKTALDNDSKIIKIRYPSAAGEFTVYLVNTNKLTINSPVGFLEERIMILCSGEVEIKLPVMQGQLDKSSIIGSKIKIGQSNMQISSKPFEPANPGGGGHAPLKETDVYKILNGFTDAAGNHVDGIAHYAPNLVGGGGGGIGPGTSYSPSDYE